MSIKAGRQTLTIGLVAVLTLLAAGTGDATPLGALDAPGAAAAPSMPADSVLIIENAGQWPATARFQVWSSPLGRGTTWLAPDAIWLVVGASRPSRHQRGDSLPSSLSGPEREKGLGEWGEVRATALRISFPGSNADVRIEPFDPLTTTVSYFVGDDPAQWHYAVPVWGGVRYVDLYPGVDLVMGGRDRAWRLETAPTAAVNQVRLQIEGAPVAALDGTALQLDATGELLSVALPSAPFAYRVEGVGRLNDPPALTVPFGTPTETPASPDDDPADLLYSTFLGGNSNDYGYAIAVDGAGSAYVAGQSYSDNFPTTPGAFDPSRNGNEDAFVVKLNPAGSGLIYATFLGGSDRDRASAIAVDGAGRAYVAGRTLSANFPTTPGAFDTSFNGGYFDAFAVRLNGAGSGLEYATFLGGGNHDESYAIAIDSSGRAYVTGGTNSSDFPTTPGAFDTTLNYNGDAFVVRLNAAGSGLSYATFLGGQYPDNGYAVAVDGAGSAYVSGETYSDDFPTTPGAFDRSQNGGWDAFVVKFNPAGSALVYGTFLGGSGDDQGFAIAVDAVGSAYGSGETWSSNFPTTPGAFDPTYNGGDGDAFVAKLNSAGSGLDYATFLGGSAGDHSAAIAVDGAGSAYLAGQTGSSNFPTTPGAFDATPNGSDDAFVARLNAAGNGLTYATFLGGSGGDEGRAIAVNGAGGAYATGYTSSGSFPTTPGAFDTTHNGSDDAFVAKLNLEPYTPNVLAPIEQPRAGAFVSGTVTLSGFAVDLGSSTGTGIDAVHIYLDGPTGTGTLVGAATYGLSRPDVAAQYGARFEPSGWELAWNTAALPPGVHRLYLYAHRTADNAWSPMDPHPVILPGSNLLWLPSILKDG